MIFDTYVGSQSDLEKVRSLLQSGPAVDAIKVFANTDQLIEHLKRDQHYLNMAVICGDYNSSEQRELRKAIKKYDPKASVIFYDPNQ